VTNSAFSDRTFAISLLISAINCLAFITARESQGELDGCAARFQCRTAFRHDGGDHTIFIGEVVEFDHWDREPLVFHGGRYAVAIAKPTQACLPGKRVRHQTLSHDDPMPSILSPRTGLTSPWGLLASLVWG